MGVVLKRAQYFIRCNELHAPTIDKIAPEKIRQQLIRQDKKQITGSQTAIQLSLFNDTAFK